ncbi:MAG: bifunctional nuclease family protein [Rhodothermales bacterium]|nr:bifunctional nuclease family protein [Rhodothermales bacterium]
MDYIQVDIIGLSTSPSSGGAYALVLGEVDGNRRLPIIIGAFEAQAIALELEKIQPPRPMTHDLIRNLFEAVEADVTDVVIDDLREGTFFAKIRYVANGKEAQLDARPSDAVALAVRTDAPIYVVPAVLEEAGIPAEDEVSPLARATPEPEEQQGRSGRTRLERMQDQLDKAIESEDYERAAQLRDEIERLKKEN